MAEDAGSIYAEVRLRLDKLEADIVKAQTAIDGFGKTTENTTTKASKGFDQMQTVALAASAGIVLAIRSMITNFAKFDQAMANVAAVTNATTEEMKDLRAAAEQAGATTRFSASEAAEALFALGQAGFTAEEAISGLNGVLLLAGASGEDLGRVAEITASTIAQFGLEASATARIANVFAAAAAQSQASVSKLGESLKFVGPVAGAMGIQLEEATASLEALYNAGFTGESAGAALRNILGDLGNEAGPVVAKLERLGIAFREINPDEVGLTAALGRLEDANLSAADALSIFGDRGGPQLLSLLKVGEDELIKMEAAITGTEEAARQYAVQNDTLAGSFDEMTSAAEGASNALIQQASPAFRFLLDLAKNLLNIFTGLPKPIQAFVSGIVIAGGALLATATAMKGLGLSTAAVLGPIGLVVSGLAAIGIAGGGIAAQAAAEAEKAKSSFREMAKAFGAGESAASNLANKLDSYLEANIKSTLQNKKIGQTSQELGKIFDDLSAKIGVSRDQLAASLLVSSEFTTAEKTRIISTLSASAAEKLRTQGLATFNKVLGNSIENEKKAAEETKKAALEKLTAEQSFKLGVQNALKGIADLRAAGILSDQEYEKQRSEIYKKEIDRLTERVKQEGIATKETKLLLQENVAAYTDAQNKLDALTDKEKEAEEQKKKLAEAQQKINDISIGQVKLLENERDALLATTTVEEERLQIKQYYADQIDTINKDARNKELANAQTLTELIGNEVDKQTAQKKIGLTQQLDALREAGATEEEITKYTAQRIEEIELESQSAKIKQYSDYVSQVTESVTGLISAIGDLYQQDIDNQLEALDAKLQAQLEAIDAETQTKLEIAGVEEETQLEKLQREYNEAVKAGNLELADKKKKELTRAQIEKEGDDKRIKAQADYEKKKAQLTYEGELAAWELKLINAIATAPLMVMNAYNSGVGAGYPAGLVLGGVMAALAGVTAAVNIASISAAKPKPPAFATGGIMLPQGQEGQQVTVADQGGGEIMFGTSALGQPLMQGFADMVASKIPRMDQAERIIMIQVDGRTLAEIVAPYYNNGEVELNV